MSDTIERAKVLDILRELHDHSVSNYPEYARGIGVGFAVVEDAPAAEPTRRAEWVRERSNEVCYCSLCKSIDVLRPPFCRDCGARMANAREARK